MSDTKKEVKELIPAGTKLTLEEYKVLALRTESIVDEVKANKPEYKALLEAFIACGELLDCLKKKIYYKKSTKYDEKFDSLTDELLTAIATMKRNRHTPEEVVDEVSPRITHGVLGVLTESSELAQAYLKGLNGGELDAVNLQEEMADGAGGCGTSWYAVIIEDETGLDPYEGMRRNINKLAIRYPEKFTVENA
ncbi:MAG: hypothetical protein EPN31_15805, partial [Castellaniella sp.]|uniref:hypothetical protein n=1 Tax=Castellaniella sp. TaxID=1955812 RepID=UPI0011F40DF7